MRVLVAEDDPVGRRLLATHLASWGYQVVETARGDDAWDVLGSHETPQLAILDWMLPAVDGVELCRRIRARGPGSAPMYVLILTSRSLKSDLVDALEAGADDYLTKPFDPGELRARIRAGERIVSLQRELHARLRELEEAAQRIGELQDLLPICSYCRQVRDDKQYWHQLEHYLSDRLDVQLSHGVCPDCYEEQFGRHLESLENEEPDRG